MIIFSHPAMFLLMPLPLLPGLIGGKRKSGIPMPLDIWKGQLLPDTLLLWRFIHAASVFLYSLAWIFIVLALAGPYQSESVSMAPGREVDVIFAMDVSPSMAAMDMEPNRLRASIEFVREYLEQENGTSVGIVAFGGEASLACPPTGDYAAVLDRLDMLKPGMLGEGTALGLGIASALGHIQRSDGKKKAIVLITDGEDNVGMIHPLDIALAMYRAGVFFTVVGIGTHGTAPIEYVDPASGERLSGAYQSNFNEESLKEIASAAGGNYRYAAGSEELSRILSSLGQRYSVSTAERHPGTGISRAYLFFAIALACASGAWLARNLLLGGVA